jgi:phage-related protein
MFQLVSGQGMDSLINDFVSTFVTPGLNSITSALSNGEQTLTSVRQQLTSAFNNAAQQVPSLIQSTMDTIQQSVQSASTASAQVQAQVQQCVAQANQNLSGLQNNLSK